MGDAGPDTVEPDAAAVGDAAADATEDARSTAEVCAPRAGGTSVYAGCASATATVYCANGTKHGCSNGYRCTEWLSSADHTIHSACVPPDRTSVCDPSIDHSYCSGALELWCNHPGEGTPGWWQTNDCRKRWAPDATCVQVDAGMLECQSPSDVACDPNTYRATCTSQCVAHPADPTSGAVRPFHCGATLSKCVQNAATHDQPACIPASAVASSAPVTSGKVGLACVGTSSIQVEQYGYQWTEQCPNQIEVGPGGSSASVPMYCFAPPDHSAPFCVAADATLCNVADSAPTCLDDTHESYCNNWIKTVQDCAAPATAPYCDATTGSCAVPPPCAPQLPFTPVCAGADREWVKGTCLTGHATLAPCTNCREVAGSVTCG